AVRKFKADVKKLIESVNRSVAEKFGLPYSKQLTGYLYCLEFGFDNNNLHCHGVLLSPFIEQEWLSEQWRRIRNDGSFRVLIAEAYSFEAAIKHALEYTGKYAAPVAGAPSGWNWPSRAAVAWMAWAGSSIAFQKRIWKPIYAVLAAIQSVS